MRWHHRSQRVGDMSCGGLPSLPLLGGDLGMLLLGQMVSVHLILVEAAQLFCRVTGILHPYRPVACRN